MLFYRIENDECKGCYITGSVLNGAVTQKHPYPSDDTLLVNAFLGKISSEYVSEWLNGGVRFGFSSIAQFRAWFYDDNELMRLKSLRFNLVIYDVPMVYVGNSQSVILKNHHAKRNIKEIKNLSEFYSDSTLTNKE